MLPEDRTASPLPQIRIDYYYWINSDWAYLGNARLEEIAAKHGVEINYMPVDLLRVYRQTGGTKLSQRAPERQAYRELELARWCKKLRIHVNPTPRYMCPSGDLASCIVIAAKRTNLQLAPLSQAILHAQWVDDLDIANPKTLEDVVTSIGYDAKYLMALARTPQIKDEYEHYTNQAIAAGVFGSPSYIVEDELFWGQDRLEFLDATLAGRLIGHR